MAIDPVGVSIGAASLTMQLLDGCVKGSPGFCHPSFVSLIILSFKALCYTFSHVLTF